MSPPAKRIGRFTGRPIDDLVQIQSEMKGVHLDGNFYQYFDRPQSIVHHFTEVVKNLEIRDDDVISLGFPRSGNHFAFEVVNMVRKQSTKYRAERFTDALLESRKVDTYEDYAKEPSPRNIVAHFQARQLPKQAVEKGTKVVYLLRNPKDVLVSNFKLASNLSSPDMVFPGSWPEFLDLSVEGKFTFGTWFDHVLNIEKFMKDHPENPVHIHLYEEMVLDPLSAVTKLCHFLGNPDTLAQQIVDATKFAYMRKNASKLQREDENYLKEGSSFMRKGQVGDWKNNFTVSESELFNEIFEEKLSGSKLADLVRPYV